MEEKSCPLGMGNLPGFCVRKFASPIVARFGFPRVAKECADKCPDILANRLKQVRDDLRFLNAGDFDRLYAKSFDIHLHVKLSHSFGGLGTGEYCVRLTPNAVRPLAVNGDSKWGGDSKLGNVEVTLGDGQSSVFVEVTEVTEGSEPEVLPVFVRFEGVDLRLLKSCQKIWSNDIFQTFSVLAEFGGAIADREAHPFEQRVGAVNPMVQPHVFTNDVIKCGSKAPQNIPNHERPVAVGESRFLDVPLNINGRILGIIGFEFHNSKRRMSFVEGIDRFLESFQMVVAPKEFSDSSQGGGAIVCSQDTSPSVGDASNDASVGTPESTEGDQNPDDGEKKKHPAAVTAGCDETKTNGKQGSDFNV